MYGDVNMTDRPVSTHTPPAKRDWLAMERTILANERTLLAYIRTALACLAAAASLIEFFRGRAFVMTGYAIAPAGLGILLFGVYRHRRSARVVREIMQANTQGDSSP